MRAEKIYEEGLRYTCIIMYTYVRRRYQPFTHRHSIHCLILELADIKQGTNALIISAKFGLLSIVKCLVKKGADVNHVDYKVGKYLHYSV